MARRSDHSREQLYQLALNAAERIVETEGVKALTARNVADAIGYSAGTLYNLFDNLDDLILHLNARTLDLMHDALDAVPTKGDPAFDIDALLDAYLGFLPTHPGLWAALFDYAQPEDAELPGWYSAKIARVLGLLEAALLPVFKVDPAQHAAHAARVLWAGLHGIYALECSGKLGVVGEDNHVEMAKTLTSTFLLGLVRSVEGYGDKP
jgi:AcrR family transcriptional regulator